MEITNNDEWKLHRLLDFLHTAVPEASPVDMFVGLMVGIELQRTHSEWVEKLIAIAESGPTSKFFPKSDEAAADLVKNNPL